MGPLTDKQFWGDIANNTRQAAGGLLSATLGAPVDIATMLMRPFGYKVDDKKVVGSSEHIAGLLGLDSESIPYKVASLMPTDATDLMKYGGLLGTFAGVNAKTANKALLEAAQKMDKSGVDTAKIWQDTGWFKGPEGKWRFEIDDSATVFHEPPDSVMFPLRDVLRHEELAGAYPGIEKTWYLADPQLKAGSGQYFPPAKAGERGIIGVYTDEKYLPHETGLKKSIALHEIQHAIQEREGFAKGGSPEVMHSVLESLAKKADAARDFKERDRLRGQAGIARWDNGMQAYQRLAGEAEARAVQARMNMTPAERKAIAPWESYDTPWWQLIVR